MYLNYHCLIITIYIHNENFKILKNDKKENKNYSDDTCHQFVIILSGC